MTSAGENPRISLSNFNGDAVPALIEVKGDVAAPGAFKFKNEANIFDYLEQAGGIATDPIYCNLVLVRSYGDIKKSLLFRLDQKESLPKIKAGDVIIVNEVDELKKVARKQFHKPKIKAPQTRDSLRLEFSQNDDADKHTANPFLSTLRNYIRNPRFKRIVNQIATHQAATGTKSISILSYERNEGKSLFCAAIALAYSTFLNSQVLVIDSNKETSPFLDSITGDYSNQVSNRENHPEKSFVDLVSAEEIEREYSHNSDFYFAPYIKSVAERYDLILIDTCALTEANEEKIDPMVLASQVDAVIVVNSVLSSNKKSIEKFAREIKTCGAQLIGTVFNPNLPD